MERDPRRRRHGMRDLLHGERRRTGVALAALVAGRRDMPEGFDGDRMRLFYRGLADTIDRRQFDYVIALWRALPDRQLRAKSLGMKGAHRQKVDLSPEIRAEIREHWLRVGLSAQAFFKLLEQPPPGLTSRIIARWISEDAPGRARPDHLEFVLTAWRNLPDRMGRLRRIHFIPFAKTG
jgi:hypothetical protein